METQAARELTREELLELDKERLVDWLIGNRDQIRVLSEQCHKYSAEIWQIKNDNNYLRAKARIEPERPLDELIKKTTEWWRAQVYQTALYDACNRLIEAEQERINDGYKHDKQDLECVVSMLVKEASQKVFEFVSEKLKV
jgi:glutamyl-tRNA reductase